MAAPSEGTRVPRVSGIVPDPRHSASVRIQVGGRTLLTVPLDVVNEERIGPGDPLLPAVHERLCRAADAEAAFRTALRCLERRPFARWDLARRLVLRGHPPEASEQAVLRAESAGLLNDEAFTRHFVQTRAARGRGPARLRRELTSFGVAASLVERIIAEELPEDTTRAAVRALAKKRAGQLSSLDPLVRFRRVVAYLARRGYRGAEVRAIALDALKESPPTE